MLLDLLAKYYKYLWMTFGAFALLKIILSYGFHGSLESINNMLVSIFKWYSRDEKDLEEEPGRIKTMNALNVLTFFILLILVITFAAGLLLLFLGK
ncbi:hypothetical protein [Aridibaculum aurantiacum]|uniref:hypothetical protein n=1 Tax=Aridibaculum aurantiacum TaxID=2810307 RepID=UPI001A9659BC|nr:hypothetical protein [Aridibaculum aurantiacum]